MCVYLFAVIWLSWSIQLQTAPTFLLTSVTPIAPTWFGSFLLNKSLTWNKYRRNARQKVSNQSHFTANSQQKQECKKKKGKGGRQKKIKYLNWYDNYNRNIIVLGMHRLGLHNAAVLTFAPTAFPRLMAFLSLCWPDDEESVEPDPRWGWANAGERRVEVWPGLEVWGLCCWAMEFSNILWSTGKKKMRWERTDRWKHSRFLLFRKYKWDVSVESDMHKLSSWRDKRGIIYWKWRNACCF